MDSQQQRDRLGKGKQPTKESAIDKVRDAVLQLTLAAVSITLGAYYFFGVGEEVTVGVGVNMKTYYTAGFEHLSSFLLVSIVLIIISFIIMGKAGVDGK